MLPTLALNSQVSYSLGFVASATMSSFKCVYFVAEYFHSLHEALAGQIVDKETTTNEREITSPESRIYFIADGSLELWSSNAQHFSFWPLLLPDVQQCALPP